MKVTSSLLLIVGIFASAVVGLGEYLLHYLPGGPGGEIDMLLHVPLNRASHGHFLVVFGAPLYFVGYYGLRKIFETNQPLLANGLLICGILSFAIGGVWVSSRYFGAEVLQLSAGTPNYEIFYQSYEEHYQILVWVLRILVLLVSILYVTLILKNKIGIPKWVAIFNPIVLLIIVISSLFWFKPLGNHIAPIAMNVTHFIFFSIMLFQAKKLNL